MSRELHDHVHGLALSRSATATFLLVGVAGLLLASGSVPAFLRGLPVLLAVVGPLVLFMRYGRGCVAVARGERCRFDERD